MKLCINNYFITSSEFIYFSSFPSIFVVLIHGTLVPEMFFASPPVDWYGTVRKRILGLRKYFDGILMEYVCLNLLDYCTGLYLNTLGQKYVNLHSIFFRQYFTKIKNFLSDYQ